MIVAYSEQPCKTYVQKISESAHLRFFTVWIPPLKSEKLGLSILKRQEHGYVGRSLLFFLSLNFSRFSMEVDEPVAHAPFG